MRSAFIFFTCFTLFLYKPISAQTINTFAGGPGFGIATNLGMKPIDVAVDAIGNIYIADVSFHVVRKIDTAGIATVVAGSGGAGYSGDWGPATLAQFRNPTGVAVDSQGNVYISDCGNSRIRKVNTNGIVTTIAGTGVVGDSGDGGLATHAQLNGPYSVKVDKSGNVYIADNVNSKIRKINTYGTISTIAGDGTYGYGGDGGPAIAARLWGPSGISLDSFGNVYVVDYGNGRIRKIDTSGIISTIAGNGVVGYSGDGGSATMAKLAPAGVAVAPSGTIYIADGYNRVRQVDTAGIITTIAGIGSQGYSGDGGVAILAQITPYAITTDFSGNIILSELTGRVRKIDTSGIINLVAGNGTICYGGDGHAAIAGQVFYPYDVTTDVFNNVYIADYSNHRVRKIDTAGVISTIAGNGTEGFSGDGGKAIYAQLSHPKAVAADAFGNVYIADYGNNKIRKVDAAGNIHSVAGNKYLLSFSGDGGLAINADLNRSNDVEVDATGNIYISDNGRVRKVDTNGIINTIAGNGDTYYYNGDGRPATTAAIDPADIAVDKSGNVYIADMGNNRIRKVDVHGTISTVAGTGSYNKFNSNVPATLAGIDAPNSIAVDNFGNFYLSDGSYHAVYRVDDRGILTVLAGHGGFGFSGDGGRADSAALSFAYRMATDKNGRLYVADQENSRIRVITGIVNPNGVVQVNNANASFTLYPNPTTGTFTLKGTLANRHQNSVTLDVYNAIGQSIYKKEVAVTNSMLEHNISLPQSLSSGSYFLKINDNENGVIRFTVVNN